MGEVVSIRKKIRLENYDYSEENMYFITICIKDRVEMLGKIVKENEIELTKEGNVAKHNINKIEEIYDNIIIDEYIIMPNHIHMILRIIYKNGISISRIVKHYKTNITKEIGHSIWQKSFYEHVIRDEKDYLRIKEYIQNNIINWKKDKYF